MMILKINNKNNSDKMMIIIIMIVTAIIMRLAITNLLSTGLFDIFKKRNLSKDKKQSRLLSPQVLSEFQQLHHSVALLLFDEQNLELCLSQLLPFGTIHPAMHLHPSILVTVFRFFFDPKSTPFPFFSPPIPISPSQRERHAYYQIIQSSCCCFFVCQYDNDENKDFLMT